MIAAAFVSFFELADRIWSPPPLVVAAEVVETKRIKVVIDPPASDFANRLAADLGSAAQACDGTSISITSFVRKDTAADQTSHGMESVFLSVSLRTVSSDRAQSFEEVGTGKGPSAAADAYLGLFENVSTTFREILPKCFDKE
ncbi:hypothetical protein [Actibacterium sp. 188UL27-1]|uniref:hypothetical protein n=1 Tax=Actibacterium sp. 188UL27-1 TaxID=2786961 RepID=UPI00195C922E|nr:hypothetical protein [Actibacterium sp. 188UL27-1]MBM7066158.1 hypothetical protein [Actibacterium sp. 188UL27-1]